MHTRKLIIIDYRGLQFRLNVAYSVCTYRVFTKLCSAREDSRKLHDVDCAEIRNKVTRLRKPSPDEQFLAKGHEYG